MSDGVPDVGGDVGVVAVEIGGEVEFEAEGAELGVRGAVDKGSGDEGDEELEGFLGKEEGLVEGETREGSPEVSKHGGYYCCLDSV